LSLADRVLFLVVVIFLPSWLAAINIAPVPDKTTRIAINIGHF
jgi:hypothetical protein